MESKGLFLRIAAIVGIFGSPALLFVGATYGILSPRGFGIGLLLWFAIIVAVAIVRKLTIKASATGSQIAVDERTRRRILRGIRMNKIWIGLLLVCLPLGIVKGLAERAWLPTVFGVVINQLLIYAAAQQIKRQRRQLG
jgi:hypothetical protein